MIEHKIKQLREEVMKHDLLYDEGTPIITDSEYDQMYYELVSLEEKHPEFSDENSPTKRIYSVVVDSLKKVKHSTPMLSQDKGHTEEDIVKFANKSDDEIIVGDKEDGLTIVLKYNNGIYYEASTRGDGYIGEDVTHTVRTITNLPKKISFKGYLEVRAESVIPFSEFERINVDGKYKSPRNLVSGSVRTLNANIAKERGLSIIAFDLVKAEGITFEKDTEQLEFLKEQGFNVVPYKVFKNTPEGIKELIQYCLTYNKKVRPTIPHMIDGLVLKFNNLAVRESLGYTSKFPRWGFAFKFDSLDATTKLLNIVETVGKSGQITPNGIFEPVEIDGVTIQKASLANYDNIKERDIRIGDTIVVARANDVIPQIVSAVTELRDGTEKEILPPTCCPVCKGEVVKEEDNVHYFCINSTCSAQQERILKHFVSRNAMNIDGLGAKTVETFYEKGILSSISDIYTLKDNLDKLSVLRGFGEKKIQKMLSGIEESKHVPLSKFLYALAIPNVGSSTGKDIAKKFKTMRHLIELSKDPVVLKTELMKIDGIGETVASSMVSYFEESHNIELIEFLYSIGFTMMEEVEEIIASEEIEGKIFVITGSLSKPRNDIKKEIEARGGKVSGSVSAKTNFLVLGGYNHVTGELPEKETNSSKYKNAVKFECPIISEEELFAKMQ
ncbi:NAD-dependent DNA ligase LigA [Bacillus thuringiensis]|uniref:DNA ligase n=1 Tax=Bacillus thuringiensis TaxID=1428 RepID=A0A9X6VEB6_BACTU|nr:NAD-dependent DNA ligase LigA [Bacillus thuringiensis]MEC3272621.1 NAD-dependent DNA ligase LigA [Bacillus thuringiensis]PFB09114.1 DNA ligase (NAD(+)) LigA [Bacillus thuringiensis]